MEKVFFYIGACLRGSSGAVSGYNNASTHFMSNLSFGSDWRMILNTNSSNTAVGGTRQFSFYSSSTLSSGQSLSMGFPTCALITAPSAKYTLGGIQYDDSSGRALKRDLDRLVVGMHPKIPRPVFSVCDSNCFHNSAYIFGKYALDEVVTTDRFSNNPPVLIVNFDQHLDQGKADSPLVNSDGWAFPLMMNYPSCAYICIGGTGTASTTANQLKVSRRKNNGSINDVPKLQLPAINAQALAMANATTLVSRGGLKTLFGNLWTAMKAYFGLDFTYVFITVDRDCMVRNYTQWNDRDSIFENPRHVLEVADVLYESLHDNGTRLAGFDITGLPEHGTSSLPRLEKFKNTSDARTDTQIISDAKTELNSLYTKVSGW